MAVAQEQDRLWRGSPRSARDEERRRRLREAALEIYGTTGYASAAVRDVCRLAHVSTRSFYELYPEQSELLLELYRELNDEVLAGFAEARVDLSQPAARGVRDLVSAALAPMLHDERKARVLEVEAVGVSDVLERERRQAYREFAGAIDAVFAAFLRAGTIRTEPPPLTALILVGGITEALVQRVQAPPQERLGADAFIDQVADVILRVLELSGPG
ncbi:MAG: TetR family transcriptional regulator [Actinobacteria bacterium]|nr:TetR family transcriptional regulator [Actinomycetota bacterium]